MAHCCRIADEVVLRALDDAVVVGVEPAKVLGSFRAGFHFLSLDLLVFVCVGLESFLERREERFITTIRSDVDHVGSKYGDTFWICADFRYPPQSLSLIKRISIDRL